MQEEIQETQNNRNWRVKVYVLDKDGEWCDCGAGVLEVKMETFSGKELQFIQVTTDPDLAKNNPPKAPVELLSKLKRGTEDDDGKILHLPILAENTFESQDDSIISWIDNELQEEIAISFLDTLAMRETWIRINRGLGRDPGMDANKEYNTYDELPIPTRDNLEQVKHELETQKHLIIAITQDNSTFLENLYRLFQELEETQSPILYQIYEIVKIMIYSEDVGLFELLLSDNYYLLVFAALDYDSEATGNKINYREFLQNQATYKKVIDFNDEDILKKIRLNYRINYLKDSIVSSVLDDPLSNQFNQIGYYANQDIFEFMMMNHYYIDELFCKMPMNLSDSIGFLYELTQIVKALIQVNEKTEYCRKLVEKNVFSMIAKALSILDMPNHPEVITAEKKITLKINLVDILFYIIQFELESFIDFLRISTNSNLMVECIIKNLFYGDQGLQIQITELIKHMIDTVHERKNEILDILYEKLMPAFIEHYKQMERNEKYYSFVQQFVEILIHCIKSHWYRIRHFILCHDLLHKLYQGFQSREKSLHLALIRLVKSIIQSKDEFFINHLLNNHLIDDLFNLYEKNARKNNLLSSSCLEFFVIIAEKDIRKLILEVGEKFQDRIKALGQEKYFAGLLNKYEILIEEINEKANHEAKRLPNGVLLPVSSSAVSEVFDHYTEMERENIEDEEYFDNDVEEEKENKSENSLDIVEPIVEVSPLLEETPPGTASPLSEDQINIGKTCFQRMKDKLASKKLEAEEDDKFSLKNKGRKMSSSSDRSNNHHITFQLSLTMNEENEDNNGMTSLNMKRAGTDLTSDEELTHEIVHMDSQKKIKT